LVLTPRAPPIFAKVFNWHPPMVASCVARFHQDMADTPYAGNRALGMLSVFFGWCERHGYRERNTNPCDGVTKFKEHKWMDFMGAAELAILGSTLARMEQTWLERQKTKEKRSSELVDAITPQAAAARESGPQGGGRGGDPNNQSHAGTAETRECGCIWTGKSFGLTLTPERLHCDQESCP